MLGQLKPWLHGQPPHWLRAWLRWQQTLRWLLWCWWISMTCVDLITCLPVCPPLSPSNTTHAHTFTHTVLVQVQARVEPRVNAGRRSG